MAGNETFVENGKDTELFFSYFHSCFAYYIVVDALGSSDKQNSYDQAEHRNRWVKKQEVITVTRATCTKACFKSSFDVYLGSEFKLYSGSNVVYLESLLKALSSAWLTLWLKCFEPAVSTTSKLV